MKYTVSIALFTLGIAAQASFVLNGGSQVQTIASVLLLAAVSVVFLCAQYRPHRALVGTIGILAIGFLAEAIGVATGFPFGEYAYSGSLGWSALGVSLIVPLAWLMMTISAWLMGRIVAPGAGIIRRTTRVVFGAAALVAWDVFLDTQMVADGNWGWQHPEPSLIGTPGIPLTNYAGWLLVGMLLMLWCELMFYGKTRKNVPRTVSPVWIYVWTWAGSIIANLTFWERPELAVTGGIAMGGVLSVVAWQLRAARRKKARV